MVLKFSTNHSILQLNLHVVLYRFKGTIPNSWVVSSLIPFITSLSPSVVFYCHSHVFCHRHQCRERKSDLPASECALCCWIIFLHPRFIDCFLFVTGFLCVVLTVLDRLTLNSQRSTCLCCPSAGTKDTCHRFLYS